VIEGTNVLKKLIEDEAVIVKSSSTTVSEMGRPHLLPERKGLS
jgi:hypothetical protein